MNALTVLIGHRCIIMKLINWARLIVYCKLLDKHNMIIEKVVKTEHFEFTFYHCSICNKKLGRSRRLKRRKPCSLKALIMRLMQVHSAPLRARSLLLTIILVL